MLDRPGALAGFVPAGEVEFAIRADAPALSGAAAQPRHARHQAGLRYEAGVKEGLSAWCDSRRGVQLLLGPWFQFGRAGATRRWCQPDAIADRGPSAPLLILEIKRAIEPRAWWQLDLLYRPVVEKAFGRPARVAAICASFDPAVRARIPVPVALTLGRPAAWLDALSDPVLLSPAPDIPPALQVLQWKSPGGRTL